MTGKLFKKMLWVVIANLIGLVLTTIDGAYFLGVTVITLSPALFSFLKPGGEIYEDRVVRVYQSDPDPTVEYFIQGKPVGGNEHDWRILNSYNPESSRPIQHRVYGQALQQLDHIWAHREELFWDELRILRRTTINELVEDGPA